MLRKGSIFPAFLLLLAPHKTTRGQDDKERTPQNGFFNNLFEPEWGAVGSELLRSSAARYSDQVYELDSRNRPNPLVVSESVHNGKSGTPSSRGRNAMLVYFGQLVVDEIVDSRRQGCPPEYENIRVPEGHLYRDKAEHMVFKRSVYNQRTGVSHNNPRQQQNSVTPFLDASFLYGTSQFWTNALREFRGGRLKASGNNFPAPNTIRLPLSNPPVPVDHTLREARRFYTIGNTRGHENPFLLALQIVWFRWHNIIAEELAEANQDWVDEQVFQETKRRVTAHFQKIVIKDWLPRYLYGSSDNFTVPEYKGYNPRVQPGISQEFTLGAMKFGHVLVPAGVWTLNTTTSDLGPDGEDRQVSAVRLCNTFWTSEKLVEANFGAIIQGMTLTLAKAETPVYVPDLREYLYGPYEFSRQDLAAVDIQRSRDHGVGSYNAIREDFNLSRVESLSDLAPSSNISNLYGSVDDLDLITGGLLETSASEGPGPLFTKIIEEQFDRIRHGDRFWYENRRNKLFSDAEIADIEIITFDEILSRTSGLTQGDITDDAFICPPSNTRCRPPPDVDLRNDTRFGVCTGLQTFDFFTGSEISFALSILAIGLTIPGSIGVLMLLVRRRQRKTAVETRRNSRRRREGKKNKYTACEWMGPESGERNVSIEFDSQRKKIKVTDLRGKDLRFIDLRNTQKVTFRISYDKNLDLISVRIPGEVDLILRLPHLGERQEFVQACEEFLVGQGVEVERQEQPELLIIRHSNNKDDRQKLLDKFFRVICLQALKHDPTSDQIDLDSDIASDVIKLKLTRSEFAESLGLKASSIFVRNVFLLADTNNDGFLSFKEFLDLFAVFATGSADDKARMLFNIYDIRRRGYLTRDDFFRMIRSLLDLSDASLDDAHVTELMQVMFRDAGISDQEKMTLADFKKIFASKDYEETLQAASIAGGGAVSKFAKNKNAVQNRRTTFLRSYSGKRQDKPGLSRSKSMVRPAVKKTRQPIGAMAHKWFAFSRYVEYYQTHIFWLSLYTLVAIGIFIERSYYYAVGREHAGLRRLSGAGTTAMIRGSASVIMFNFASLLVTMCRNIITRVRETFLHRFIPFDSAVSFHKYIAWMLMVATIVHIVGHCINLYCMSTQPAQDIACLFREFVRSSHQLYTFHYWAFQTITGLAGVAVTVLIFVMYVFATQFARSKVFTAFWFTHSLYVLAYILTFLHGIGRLVQAPLFPWFMIGPLVLFILDRLMSASRNKVEITVKKAELLPSAVIELVFKRPSNFDYKSGQWVRIACLDLGKGEYHPFTLTSAPHEENLSLHIRAVGPWTNNLRKVYDPNNLGMKPFPKLYLDGPFGEGHQDWYTFDVAVLVGGGIGVTPFASILKDIAFKSQTGNKFTCKKVYFVWVTRTQKHYEWLVDVIRDVENKDSQNLVSVHIFITQFQQKFDLRTTMLYICERHFQKVENRSLFTGLKATTHFGRPMFEDFLGSLRHEHPQVQRIGVFSCGPGPMTRSVQTACSFLNGIDGPSYTHHFENF